MNNQSAAFHDNPYALFHEYNHRTIYQWNVFSGDVSVDLPYNLKAGVRVMVTYVVTNWNENALQDLLISGQIIVRIKAV